MTPLTDVIAIAGGGNHSLALKSDGTVWAWGYNVYGQLGDGTTTNRLTPVQVSGVSGVMAIVGGGRPFRRPRRSDGRGGGGGTNVSGKLGKGNITTSSVQVGW